MLLNRVWKSFFTLSGPDNNSRSVRQPHQAAYPVRERTFEDELAGLSTEERERRIRIRQQYERFAQRQRIIDVEDQAAQVWRS